LEHLSAKKQHRRNIIVIVRSLFGGKSSGRLLDYECILGVGTTRRRILAQTGVSRRAERVGRGGLRAVRQRKPASVTALWLCSNSNNPLHLSNKSLLQNRCVSCCVTSLSSGTKETPAARPAKRVCSNHTFQERKLHRFHFFLPHPPPFPPPTRPARGRVSGVGL
jgi:hypothetical protein